MRLQKFTPTGRNGKTFVDAPLSEAKSWSVRNNTEGSVTEATVPLPKHDIIVTLSRADYEMFKRLFEGS